VLLGRAGGALLRRQSPSRTHHRQGSPALRWALVEAAQKITTGSGPLREKFERIAKRRGRKIAKVAIAREILTLAYYGLRDGEIRCLARRSRASAKEKLHDRRALR
jgi:transposase